MMCKSSKWDVEKSNLSKQWKVNVSVSCESRREKFLAGNRLRITNTEQPKRQELYSMPADILTFVLVSILNFQFLIHSYFLFDVSDDLSSKI